MFFTLTLGDSYLQITLLELINPHSPYTVNRRKKTCELSWLKKLRVGNT